jgi:DNA-binding CsgD family transcriptional regulator
VQARRVSTTFCTRRCFKPLPKNSSSLFIWFWRRFPPPLFLKHSSPELLTEAIHKVMAGETWIDQRRIQALAQAVDQEGRQSRRNELSERERQVLKGVFAGLSNKGIGTHLKISEASVKSALQQLFVKTGVRTCSQVVRVVLEEYGTGWGLRTWENVVWPVNG